MIAKLFSTRFFLPVVFFALSLAPAQTGRQYNRDYSKTKQIFAEIKTHEGTMKV